jgi:hypothetical protein
MSKGNTSNNAYQKSRYIDDNVYQHLDTSTSNGKEDFEKMVGIKNSNSKTSEITMSDK